MLHIASVVLLAVLYQCSGSTLKTCGGELSGMYGDFQSPGFPDKYPKDVNCVWNITVAVGHHVRVEFTEFQLEEHSYECEYDRVTVLEGSTKLALFCGNPATDGPKAPVVSKDQNMLVQLYSDYSETAPGFWAHFSAVDTDECLENNGGCTQFCHNYIGGYYCSCSSNYELQADGKFCKVVCNGIVKTDLHGVISSPEYPNTYPDQAQCDWNITLPLGYQIEATFLDMDIEDHHEVKCPYDSLKIDAGRSTPEGPYCGQDTPSPVVSQANKMHLFFTSDDSVGQRGFKATYRAKPLDCGNPGTPGNGLKIGTNYTFPNSVRFTCNRGFQLVGSSRRDCQTDGTWSGTSARCTRVSCGDPGIPAHGRRSFIAGVERTYVFEDKVELKCKQLYTVAGGNSIRRCGANGNWSGTQLTCKPVCGKRTYYNRGKIIGGSSAREGTYPWMAMLYRSPCATTHCLFCGASILDNNYVLTAAHCIRGIGNSPFVVRVGAHQARSNVQQEWWCTVKRVVMHPSYDHNTYDYDAALIEIGTCNSTDDTASEIELSDYIRPICLPDPSSAADVRLYNPTTLGTAAGWGKRKVTTSASAGFAKILRHVELPISNSQVCQNHFRPQNWVVTPQMFCAGAVGQDTCHGDSGGPFMAERGSSQDAQFVLLGIISWGDDRCASGYGVYTKVTSIVAWIKKTTGSK